jgi:predicted transcriptional regulator
MKHYLLIAVFCLLAACEQSAQQSVSNQPQSTVEVKSQVQTLKLQSLSAGLTTEDNTALKQAFALKQSHVWLEGNGIVKKLLPDDTKGAKHQRFLVSISPEQTLLFAHNIDLAPRVPNLDVGDHLQFKGEYIYNPKGGIMHWTHHDPGGKQGGWIKVNGHIYE